MSRPVSPWLGRWSVAVPLAMLALTWVASSVLGVDDALRLDGEPWLALFAGTVMGTIGTVVTLRRTLRSSLPRPFVLVAVALPWLLAVGVHLSGARDAARSIANADASSVCIMGLRGHGESLGATLVGARVTFALAIAAALVFLRAWRERPHERDLVATAALAGVLGVLALVVSTFAQVEAATLVAMSNADVASRALLVERGDFGIALACGFAVALVALGVAAAVRAVTLGGLADPARAPELAALVLAVLVPLLASVVTIGVGEHEAFLGCEAPWARARGFRPLRLGEPLDLDTDLRRDVLVADPSGLRRTDGVGTTVEDLFARLRATGDLPALSVAPDRGTPARVLRGLVVSAQHAHLSQIVFVGLDVGSTVPPSFPWLPAAHAAVTQRVATFAFDVPPWGWDPEVSWRTLVTRVGRRPGIVRRFVDGTAVDLDDSAAAAADEVMDPNARPVVVLALDDDATAGSLFAAIAPIARWLGWQNTQWVLVPGPLPRL